MINQQNVLEKEGYPCEYVMVHKNDIVPGDIIMLHGVPETVGKKDIKCSNFMGRTIFGDSFKLGTTKVEKLLYERQRLIGVANFKKELIDDFEIYKKTNNYKVEDKVPIRFSHLVGEEG